eukprot:GHVU01066628.1.p1 GENE.GHVU01066628.1~~GHVU01066628.1.p1  ORF type:complete len:109 (+),score=6.13 GHVU01066628.1:246-572(+)
MTNYWVRDDHPATIKAQTRMTDDRRKLVEAHEKLGVPAKNRIYEIFWRWDSGEYDHYKKQPGKLLNEENIDNYSKECLQMLRGEHILRASLNSSTFTPACCLSSSLYV